MLKIIKQEINLSPSLKRKIDFASSYANLNVVIKKGYLIRLEPTNIAYVEPHKITINNKIFLFFNNSNNYYINTLNNKYLFSTLQNEFLQAKNN